MAEDLKLFGEVGLGYSQLQKDVEEINNLITSVNKNVGTLSGDLEKNNISVNVKFDPNSAKQMNDLSAAIKHIENTSTTANKAVNNMTADLNKIGATTGKVKKEFETITSSVEKFNKSGAIKNPFEGIIATDMKSVAKELESYFSEINKVATKNFNIENLGKSINDELRFATKGTEEFNRALEMSGKYTDYANTRLGDYKNQLRSVREAISKATDAETMRKEFLSKKPLSESDFSKMTESIGASVEKKARSSAIKYVDEFGRTIRETWQKKAGSFFPSTQKIIADPLKKQEAEISATIARGEKVVTAVINRRRQVEKTAHNERMSELKKEQSAQEKSDSSVNPSKIKNLGQTVSELYAVKRILQETVKVAADFQEKQIEVERIAQNNTKDAKELKQAIFDIAKETGTMVGDVQEVAGLWARTGKSGEQLKEAVKTTMMGFNVADFKDAETAVASINAIVNQMYNGDATKSQSILDSLVKVADKTAVRNVEDLAEVASRAGANAKALKMDLHELNAVSSIAMENMKLDGKVLGTQLKSVFAYMMNDGRMKKLEKFGVEMTKNNANGTKSLKSFSEAFGDVVKKYREFMASGDEKRANDLLSTIGGTRFTPLIKNLADNWEKFESRVALSKDSVGFASEQNEKKMKSLNKQILALKASATELLESIGESGILQSITAITKRFKGFIDMLNKIPGAVNAIIPTLTVLHVALTALTLKAKIGLRDDSLLYFLIHGIDVVDGKFKIPGIKDGIDKLRGLRNEAQLTEAAVSVAGSGMAKAGKDAADMASDVGKAGEAVKTAEGATKEMAGAAVNGGSALAGLKAAFNSAKAGVASLVTGVSASTAAFAAVAVAIAAVGAALIYTKKKNDELLNNTISGKFDKELEDIENMHDAYIKIQGDTEAFKGGTDAHEQLVDVQGRLAEALGVSKEAYSTEASTIGETNKVIEARIALKKSEIAAEKEKGIEQAKNFLKRAEKSTGFDYQNESLVHNAEKVRQAMSLLETTSKKVEDLRRKGADNKQIESALKNQENALAAVRENYEKLLPVYEKVKQAGDALGKPGAADEILEKNNYGNLIETVASKLKEKAEASEEAAEGSDKHAASMEAEQEQLKKLADECDNYASKINAMDSARKEYNETGELSLGTVSNLITKYPELVNCLEKVGDKYVLNKQFLEAQTEAADEYKGKVDEAIEQARTVSGYNVGSLLGDIGEALDTQAIDDFLYKLKELDSEVYNSVSSLNEQFMNGSIAPEEFFRKLKDSINNIDLTKLSTTDIQNFSNAIQTYLTSSVQSLDSQLQSGEITRAKYDSQLRNIRQKALDLYTALNGLSYVDGSWVDSNGKVDKYANSLQKLIGNTNKTKNEMDDAKDSVDGFNDSLSEVGDVDIDLSGFTEGFTNAFEEIREGLGQAYEDIMGDSDGYTDALLDNFWSILDGVNSSGQTAISSLATAVGSMFEGLVKSTSDSGNQTLGVVGNIAASLGRTTFSFLAHSAFGRPVDFNLGNLLGGILSGRLLSSFGFVFGSKGKTKVANMTGGKVSSHTTSSGGTRSILPSFLTTERFNKLGHETSKGKPSTGRSFKKLFNKLFEVQETFPGRVRRQNRKNRSNSNYSDSSKSSGSNSKNKNRNRSGNDEPDHDILPRDHSGSGGGGGGKGRGGKGGGGGGKGSSSKQDIPEKVQKQIDSLRHKLDMDEMDQYQYAKEIEKILDKNKNILTEKGIREIEKMVYDAKKGGVKDGFKAHIDELKNLNELAEQTIQSLESEKQMVDSLNLNPNLKLGINQDLSEVYSGKLIVSLSMVRKYQLAIEEIDKELKGLNSSSVGYSKTVEELNKVKDDYIKKLREEEEAVTKTKDATAKLAMEQYKIKQMQIDKAIENLEHINQLTIQMINGRNEKIKERVQERHRAEMEALEKENDAKNKAHRKQMDRMQREADAFRRYMEDKMKALNRENAKEDYETDVAKRSKEIVEIKDQINILSMDDSYKAKGEVIKLRKTLNDKQEELARIQRERERTITQEGLQDQLTEYERQLQSKQDLMNKETEAEEEKNNNALELLRKRQEAEMKALEETMTAKAVAAEAEMAIKTGVVKDIDGKSRNLRDAIISHMQEIGEWSGILSQKMITEFNAVYNQINNTLQMLGLGGKASFGPLQQQLGLTDESYTAWKQDVSNKTGVAFEDVEEYIQNKMAWGGASPEERKNLERANHLIRKKIVDAHGGDQSYNKDKNGLVYGLELLPNRDDKRWNFVQSSPRFAVHPGMTREGSEKLANYDIARNLYPEKSSQITGDIRTLQRYEPSAANYDLSYIVGNRFANDINKIGKAHSILDVPADQLELEELRRIVQNERSGLNGGSGGYSGTGAVDYNRMVDDIMSGASPKKKDFIKKILPKAMEVSKKYRLPLAAILGQAIEESGWGSGSSLFGIKNASGNGYKQHNNWDEAIEYYGYMMSGRDGKGRWASSNLSGITDPNEYLRKIQDKNGPMYCEDPKGQAYTKAVMGVIESNNLMAFQNANVDKYRTGGYGGDGGARERLLSEAHKQDGMPYSMGPERETTHRDCSSYVYFATKNSGLYSGSMFYTGNMREALAKDGWKDIGQIPKDQIRRGDIFWYVGGGVHHTEIATEDGTLKTTGAHRRGKPAGPSSWIYNYHILRHPSLNPFKNGGIADFTGPAMLHGTKTNPEYIFNSPQFDALGKIVAKYATAPSIYAPRDLTSTYDPVVNVQVDNLVQINGNATKETVQEIKDASTDVLKNLEKALRKRGK